MCAIMGCDPDNFNSTRWDVYADLDPAGTSVQNINHWGQMVRKHEFCYYSYLTAHENKKVCLPTHKHSYVGTIGFLTMPSTMAPARRLAMI